MRTDELDFELPAELIAQEPLARRTDSRLLHYRRSDRAASHRRFTELPELLRPGDLLVFNDAQVLPARFTLRKSTGGRVEGLFLEEVRPGRWYAMLKNLGTPGAPLHFADAPEIAVKVIAFKDGVYEMDVHGEEPALALLGRIGRMPLPPYIRRDKEHDARDDLDRERYQTVFARTPGAIAAPTAALHFSQRLLDSLAARQVERAFVTLHVGVGTFKPVTAENLEEHDMHVEHYSVGAAAADALNRAKSEGRRVIAVGTTSARVLESQPADELFVPKTGDTRIFIRPPYAWKLVDALITNFHLPRSTLVALVAALVGLEEQRRLYRIAIDERYRFFSYGDAMLIE